MLYDPKEFSRRLRNELERCGWDNPMTTLHEKLVAATNGAKGTSRPQIYSHLVEGPADPRVEVVNGYAKVFGVRPEYLLYGGPRTEAEAEAEADMRMREPLTDQLRERIPALSGLPSHFVLGLLNHAGRRAALEWQQQRPTTSRPPSEQQEQLFQYAEEAWRDIVRPLAGHSTASYAVFNYLDAALHARNLALMIISHPYTEEEA